MPFPEFVVVLSNHKTMEEFKIGTEYYRLHENRY